MSVLHLTFLHIIISVGIYYLYFPSPYNQTCTLFLLLVAQLYLILCNPVDCSTRLPCPSPSPRTCSNLCPLSPWCHLTISSSVISFSSCLQSSPASGSFLMSWFFASVGQSIRASASASILLMNIQDWFPLGLTGWISLQSKELLKVFSNTIVQKHQFFGIQPSLWSNSHIHTWLLEKTTALTFKKKRLFSYSLLSAVRVVSSVLYIPCIHGGHPVVISPGGVHVTSGCVNDSSFLWTIFLHCGLSLCQSYNHVTVIVK